MKRIVSLFLALAMVGSLAACSSQPSDGSTAAGTTAAGTGTTAAGTGTTAAPTETTEESKAQEIVPITVFPPNANLTSGTVGGWRGDYLAENGLSVDVWAYSADKYNSILTSGDLPDIMYLDARTCDVEALTESGYFLNLEEYMDYLPHVQEAEGMDTAINYVKEFVTGGTLSVLPTAVGSVAPSLNTGGMAIMVDWELYEQIGAPEFSNLDELIPVLKQMQEARPTTASGAKTYAMHLYSGSDTSYFAGFQNVAIPLGYNYDFMPYFLTSNTATEEYEYILEDDGIYKYAMKWLNQLYREGLLDPDSITQDRATVISYWREGDFIVGWPTVPAYETDGCFPVSFADQRILHRNRFSPYGGNSLIAISSKCENVEAALKYLDMLADPDFWFIMQTGPQGDMWDLNEAGEPVLTEMGEKYFVNGETVEIQGEDYIYWNTIGIVNSGANTSYGKGFRADYWPEVLDAKNSTETAAKWKEHYGYNDYKDLLNETGDYVNRPFDMGLNKFTSQPTDEQSLLIAAANGVIVEYSWKMVYAESDAEFEQLWAECVKECEGVGAKDLAEFMLEDLEGAAEIKASLEN